MSDWLTEKEREELAQSYRERAKEDLEICDAMNHGPELRAYNAERNSIIRVLNYRFGIGNWEKEGFDSSAFDACDSISAIDEIVNILRTSPFRIKKN